MPMIIVANKQANSINCQYRNIEICLEYTSFLCLDLQKELNNWKQRYRQVYHIIYEAYGLCKNSTLLFVPSLYYDIITYIR